LFTEYLTPFEAREEYLPPVSAVPQLEVTERLKLSAAFLVHVVAAVAGAVERLAVRGTTSESDAARAPIE
jgi:hypothetical protein